MGKAPLKGQRTEECISELSANTHEIECQPCSLLTLQVIVPFHFVKEILGFVGKPSH